MTLAGADPRGRNRRASPLKLEKIRFFGVKSWFFTRNIPKCFAPPFARRNFFKCAPLTWNPGSTPGWRSNYSKGGKLKSIGFNRAKFAWLSQTRTFISIDISVLWSLFVYNGLRWETKVSFVVIGGIIYSFNHTVVKIVMYLFPELQNCE
jgi:hypothetical protein